MTVNVQKICELMENIAPVSYAEEWDNVGLMVGDRDFLVKKVMIALDLNLNVVVEAIDKKIDMIITHHPLIFKPIKNLDYDNEANRLIYLLMKNNISVYSAHTNLDSTKFGVNDVLCEVLGLKNTNVFIKSKYEGIGLGRVAELENETDLKKYAEFVKDKLNLNVIRVADARRKVKKIAVCGGSGSDFIDDAINMGIDTYITGDLKYHEAQYAISNGLNIIDGSHQMTEMPIVENLKKRFEQWVINNGYKLKVYTAKENEVIQIL